MSRSNLSITKLFLTFFAGLGAMLLLNSCGKSNHSDLTAYLENVKKQIFSVPMKSSMSDFAIPKAIIYGNAMLRSPFEEPATAVSNVGNADSPLTGYMVSSLRFVGTITEKQKVWGIILTPTNKVYNVTVGDSIGNQNGKIVKIYRDRIEVIERVNEGSAPASKRLVTLQLKEKD